MLRGVGIGGGGGGGGGPQGPGPPLNFPAGSTKLTKLVGLDSRCNNHNAFEHKFNPFGFNLRLFSLTAN